MFDRILLMIPRTNTAKLITTTAYYLAFILIGATTASFGPSLPALAEHTSSGLDRISLIFVFSSLGYLVGSFIGGRAYDRMPGHKIMSVSLMMLGIVFAMIPLSSTLNLLLLFVTLTGFAIGILDVGCNTLLLWLHGEKAGPFINGLHFFFGVGSFIAPLLLAKVLLMTGGIVWLYWVLTISCLPIAIWLWLMPESSTHMHSEEIQNTPLPLTPLLFCVLLFLLYVGLELGFGNWVYTYAVTLGLGTTITAAYLTSAFWGAFTIGRLLGIWIAARARAQTIMFIDLVGCAISTLIIMLWMESSLALWIGTIGLGLFMASIFPTIFMFAGEKMQITGAIAGWFLVGSGVGSLLLPWLIGQIFAYTGPKALAPILLIVIAGLIIILLLFLNQQTAPKPELKG